MSKRIDTIVSLITPCDGFADVGCDHGYVAKAVLDEGKAKKVFVTDISEPSLNKAKALLSDTYPDLFTAILTDGLEGVPVCDQVLIAGMGGEEIIKILQKSAYKPVIVILQPMKNADKVRKYLHSEGYGLERDFMFFADGKYYELMRAKLNYSDGYTLKEELYGRENLNGSPDFILYLNNKIGEISTLLLRRELSEESRSALNKRLNELRGIKDETERNLRID